MFTGKHGGIPLQSLSARKRRQITSHNKHDGYVEHVPHQGSKEQARRLKQRQRQIDMQKGTQ